MSPLSAPIFRFGLSPSLGHQRAQALGRQIEEVLGAAVGAQVEVIVAGSYEHLEAMVLGGAAEAAWVNPLALARLQAAGATACLRGVRRGSATFRSALVARKGSGIDLAHLQGTRAAWTDPDSVAGYRLPVHHLRQQGLAVERLFASERFTFSYPAALGRLLDGSADVAACFVHGVDPEALSSVLHMLVGEGAERLEPIAFTDPVPNDGLVFAPWMRDGETAQICDRVTAVLASPAGAQVLELLDVEAVIPIELSRETDLGWLLDSA